MANELVARNQQLRDALEDMCVQFAYWSEGPNPGLWSGGLSALEGAFEALGWSDPHPCPEQTCDEPGCNKQVSTGWPSDDGYRHTCGKHYRVKQAGDASV